MDVWRKLFQIRVKNSAIRSSHRLLELRDPQSNRLDERMNQALNAAMQKLVNESQDDWDNAVP